MNRYFKLNKPVYQSCDVIKVSDKYSKREGGYVIECEVVNLIPSYDGGFLYGKVFCKEYYDIGGDGYTMIAESSRRNAKKAALAIKEMENARQYAEKYVEQIGNGELQIVEEV